MTTSVPSVAEWRAAPASCSCFTEQPRISLPLNPGYACFEELKHDREFLADAAGAIVTVVQPQRMPAEA